MHRYLSSAPLLLGLAIALPAMTVPSTPAAAQLAIGISVRIAPPALPIYIQPPLPAPGYIWTPGYWAYAQDGGYYWVPGTWVEPPSVGVLWTPAWWGWNNGFYGFHAGYWGPHVGFYGGIDYGFGYNGAGFFGGRWGAGGFEYNQSVNNFGGTHITNVYNETVVHNNESRAAFNGGAGGVNARPTPEQEAAEHEQHVQPTSAQTQHFETAAHEPALRASENHGNPAIAATARPGSFKEGAIAARGAPAAQVAALHAMPTPEHGPLTGRGAAAPEANRAAAPEANRAAAPEANHAAAPRTAAAPRAESHAATAPHPAAAPRPAAVHPAPRPAARPAPHPAAAPHPQARPAPHPAAAPHPAPRPAPAAHKEEEKKK
jgi:hypothetical protein